MFPTWSGLIYFFGFSFIFLGFEDLESFAGGISFFFLSNNKSSETFYFLLEGRFGFPFINLCILF
jgi:hypothetical protein